MIELAWWLVVGPLVAVQLAVSIPIGLATWPIAYAIEHAEPCE